MADRLPRIARQKSGDPAGQPSRDCEHDQTAVHRSTGTPEQVKGKGGRDRKENGCVVGGVQKSNSAEKSSGSESPGYVSKESNDEREDDQFVIGSVEKPSGRFLGPGFTLSPEQIKQDERCKRNNHRQVVQRI